MKIQITVLNSTHVEGDRIFFGKQDPESLFVWFYEMNYSQMTAEQYWSTELFSKYSKICKRLKLTLVHEN